MSNPVSQIRFVSITQRRFRLTLWLLLWAVVISGATAAIYYSQTFNNCINERNNSKEYETLKQRGGVIGNTRNGLLILDCIGDFTDRNNAAIIALATVALSVFTFTLWRSTDRLWRTSQIHASHMQVSAAEASRAATAMESVSIGIADTLASNRQFMATQRQFAQIQLRPYISVSEPAFFQQDIDRRLFAGLQITVINTGHTPAHNIKFLARVSVLQFPIPDDFDFSIPARELVISGHINPGQRFIIRRNLDRFMTDAEFADITALQGRAIYAYGTIFFSDPFGDEHYTNFSQFGAWHVKGNFSITINTLKHNDAT